MKRFLFIVPALVAVLAATACSTTAPTPPTVAKDGATLAGQPQEIQDQFRTTWGDQAAIEWVKEHNADPTTPSHPPSDAEASNVLRR